MPLIETASRETCISSAEIKGEIAPDMMLGTRTSISVMVRTADRTARDQETFEDADTVVETGQGASLVRILMDEEVPTIKTNQALTSANRILIVMVATLINVVRMIAIHMNVVRMIAVSTINTDAIRMSVDLTIAIPMSGHPDTVRMRRTNQ
jgi:hypothetical protein